MAMPYLQRIENDNAISLKNWNDHAISLKNWKRQCHIFKELKKTMPYL